MSKFYLGCSLSIRDTGAEAIARLERAGHECAYNWTGRPDIADKPEEWSPRSQAEIEAIAGSDFAVITLPGGRGTHTELGAALVACERVYLWIPRPSQALNSLECAPSGLWLAIELGFTCAELLEPYACVFHYHPKVEIITGSIASMVARVCVDFNQ